MPVDANTREAIDIRNLRLPPSPPVAEVKVEEYTDSSGEPALRVTVVLDESADVEKESGETIGNLKSAIRESLREHGVTLFPYIFLVKPSELADANDEE
jgi:hypothetical protein